MTAPVAGRGGFALVAVLWVLVGVSALALAANLAARDAIGAARNRADLAAAAWRAEDCLARLRAAADRVLAAARHDGPDGRAWSAIPAELRGAPLLEAEGCSIEMRAAGARLDVNAAGEAQLHRFLSALGQAPASADSLVDALLDWRDEDTVPRPLGAEAEWYHAAGLRPPRDGPFADVREVRRVRGWERIAGLDTLLGVEPGRVPLNHAPPAVLASLPGFTPEAVERVMELRTRGVRIPDMSALEGALSPSAREVFLAHYAELVAAAAATPEAWIVTARGAVGTPPVNAVVEVRLVNAGDRAAVVRRRTWIE